MGNIFVNDKPVCDDYADEDNNAAVLVCRFAEFISLKIYCSVVNINITIGDGGSTSRSFLQMD